MKRLHDQIIISHVTNDLDRTESLYRLAQHWFNPNKKMKLLNIGARGSRMDYLEEWSLGGYDITILEVWPKNVEDLRAAGFNVIQGDVRTFTPEENYDVVFWWHGPEHVKYEELMPTIDHILSYTTGALITGCPYGYFRQGPIEGNPYEEHVGEVCPHHLLGAQIEVLGNKDQRGSNITAIWDITTNKTGALTY